MQDIAPLLVELHEVHMEPAWQGRSGCHPSLQSIKNTTQLGVACKLSEFALNPTVCVVDKNIKLVPVQGLEGHHSLLFFHLDIEPLTLWVQPSKQFFIHLMVHPPNLYFPDIITKMLWDTTSKDLEKSE